MCVCGGGVGGGGATLALSADLTASQGPLVSEGDVCVCVCVCVEGGCYGA